MPFKAIFRPNFPPIFFAIPATELVFWMYATKYVLSPLSVAPFWGCQYSADDGDIVLLLNFCSISDEF